MSMIAAAVVSMSGVMLVVGIALLLAGAGAMALAVASLCGFAAYTIVCVLAAQREFHAVPGLGLDRKFLSYFIRRALSFSAAQLVSPIYSRGDAVILSALQTSAVVGIYGLAYSWMLLILLPADIILTSLYPFLSRRWAIAATTAQTEFRDLLASMAAIGIALGVLASLLAPLLVWLILPTTYRPVAEALSILALALPFMYVNRTIDLFLRLEGRMRVLFVLTISVTFGNLLANLVLDRPALGPNGYVGASASMIIGEVGYAVFGALLLWRTVPGASIVLIRLTFVTLFAAAALAVLGPRVTLNWMGATTAMAGLLVLLLTRKELVAAKARMAHRT
jgi:O-antigen/teichoic acid export membrane protein